MRLVDCIPGVAHWRRGRRRTAAATVLSLAGLLALLIWRRGLVAASLMAASGASVSGLRPERRHDVLTSSAVLVALIAGIAAFALAGAFRPSADGAERTSTGGPWRIAWRRFRRSRLGIAGAAIVVVLTLAALLCPLLTLHDPVAQGDIVTERLLPPSLEHPLGTDRLARDVLARVLYGSRVSLLVGFLSVGIAVTVGTLYGAAAGYAGGRVDAVLMRLVDVLLAFPTLVILITIVGLWGSRSLWLLVATIGFLSWMRVARLVRGQVLSLREREYVLAARALGAGPCRVVFRHLLPNSLTPVVVFATLGIGNAILLEAGLSYLGLGVQAPTPTWGNIVSDARGSIFSEWWIPFSAGLAVAVTVVGYNLVGDAMRDALDPRLER